VWNGSSSKKKYDIKTILATQKKIISCPVSRISLGKNVFKSSIFASGHPNTENGKRALENQVSSTSSS
jgi:hypothetical protein